jgi:small-conductance mechanosensitive channel
MATLSAAQYQLTERRIAQLTLILGAVASAGACWLFSVRVGAGILVGAVLAWLNFRWLEGAMDGLVRASTARADSAEARLPLGSVFLLIARYALIAGAVYVICSVFKVPILSMLVGLCALGAATISASLYEILSPAGQ